MRTLFSKVTIMISVTNNRNTTLPKFDVNSTAFHICHLQSELS